MRIASIRSMDISNGIGIGVSLFTQGCHFHCKNCFQPETWNFNGGKEYTEETKETILKLLEPEYITRCSVLGGEPLEECNWLDLADLLVSIKIEHPDIKIWLYTGFTYECLEHLMYSNVPGSNKNLLYIILKNIDVLVDGQFQEDKKDLTYPFAGSTNQRVIDMKRTNDCGKIVLFNEE
jgi:anaerobic ribonucleoside-triphosphate reductase activating protein